MESEATQNEEPNFKIGEIVFVPGFLNGGYFGKILSFISGIDLLDNGNPLYFVIGMEGKNGQWKKEGELKKVETTEENLDLLESLSSIGAL